LNSALYNSYIKVVKLLFKKGANIIAVNNNKWILLNSALNNSYVKVVKLLLKKDANIITIDNYK